MTSQEPLQANEILTACALRFQGWQYQEKTRFDQTAAFDRYFETGSWDLPDNEKLAAFFLLQRGLSKWDLVTESKQGRWWSAFRNLFFHVAHLPIPPKYRDDNYATRWEEQYAPRLDECLQCIREEQDKMRPEKEA